MEKSIETQASSVDLAVEKALVELGVSKDKVDVEILQKGGLFSKAKVRVTVKDSTQDKMAEFFNGTLERMGLVSRATVEDKNGTLYVTIAGDDSGVAIGFFACVADFETIAHLRRNGDCRLAQNEPYALLVYGDKFASQID